MTPESLRAFFRENILDPENTILTLYGDLDEAQARALIMKYFGSMPKLRTHKEVNFARSNAIPENVKIHKVTGKETGLVLISFAAPPMNINEKELMAVRLLNAVVGGYGYPGGWLHEELRGEGLVYAVHCVTRSGVVPGYIIFIAQTSPDKVDEVVGRLFKNIEKAKAGQITPEELNIAKQKLCSLHAQSDTTIGEQATQQGLNVLYGLGIDFDRTYDDRVNATTLEDVIAAARKFLGGNYVQVTTSNQEK
jgi:predicted Zn-dependent peptidase